MLPGRGEIDDPGVLGASRPAQLLELIQQRLANAACQVGATFAPVEAGSAKFPLFLRNGVYIDADFSQPVATETGDPQCSGAALQGAGLHHGLVDEYAEL